MKIEGDGKQYWLVLNPDPDQERIDRVIELLKETWTNTPYRTFGQHLYDMAGHIVTDIYELEDHNLIRLLEENL